MNEILVNGMVVGKEYGEVIPLGTYFKTDECSATAPFIIYDGSIYHMWYSGDDVNRYRIHYATSEDGVSWIKHGPIKILVDNNINYDLHEYDPSIIFDGSIFHMWYCGGDDVKGVYYATSEDGMIWKKQCIAVKVGDKGESDYLSIKTPFVTFDGSIYHMWYTGDSIIGDSIGYERIHYATSLDGRNWKKHGVVQALCTNDADKYHISKPFVIYDNGVHHMWYNYNFNNINKLLYATSIDGKNWTKLSDPISTLTKDGNIKYNIIRPFIIKDENLYKIWFNKCFSVGCSIQYVELSESSIVK